MVTKLIKNLSKRCKKNLVVWLCLNTFDYISYINCLCMTMTITAPLGKNKSLLFLKFQKSY